MSDARGGGRFGIVRAGADALEVRLPRSVRMLVATEAARVRAAAGEPDSAGHRRLYGPIDPARDVDDPVRLLERELAVDAVCATVLDSPWRTRTCTLTCAQAEASLQVISMALATAAAELGLVDEDAVRTLGRAAAARLQLLQVLGVMLVEALESDTWG